MLGPFIDCYVLAPSRSAKLAKQFLDHFLPHREPAFAPEDPIDVLGITPNSDLGGILTFLENHSQVGYAMYWRNSLRQEPYHAFLVFNRDNSMILGLSACVETKPHIADGYLQQMKILIGTNKGYWFVEFSPASNMIDFENDLALFESSKPK